MALALTGRRRNAAAAVSVLAAVALAIAVVGRGCRVREPGPEAAVRSLIAAANAGDKKAVFALFTPATQARLEERAQRATELVGSNVRYTALDLIAIGTAEDVPQPTEINVIKVGSWEAVHGGALSDEMVEAAEKSGTFAVVEIVSSAGRARIDLEKIEGRWRIDLPGYAAAP
jgi:hypothetical protein